MSVNSVSMDLGHKLGVYGNGFPYGYHPSDCRTRVSSLKRAMRALKPCLDKTLTIGRQNSSLHSNVEQSPSVLLVPPLYFTFMYKSTMSGPSSNLPGSDAFGPALGKKASSGRLGSVADADRSVLASMLPPFAPPRLCAIPPASGNSPSSVLAADWSEVFNLAMLSNIMSPPCTSSGWIALSGGRLLSSSGSSSFNCSAWTALIFSCSSSTCLLRQGRGKSP